MISMEPFQNIAELVQLLKGESIFWADKLPEIKNQWNGWADDYCAISVSPSNVNRVRNYIRNQEAHHMKLTFQQEWEHFVGECGFVVGGDSKVA
ncbi:MAG: transposase, partial [Bacteroidota bacterium]